MDETVYYAIGDVHGEMERLMRLHDQVREHHRRDNPGQPMTLVQLGDLIDRGPDSFGVIEFLIAEQRRQDAEIICLRGNHEQMMLDAFTWRDDRSAMELWLNNGGYETLQSYKSYGQSEPPQRHLNWLKDSKFIHHVKDRGLIFVHAGVNPEIYPNESDDLYLRTRSRKFLEARQWDNPALEGTYIIHGHTPTNDNRPEIGCGGYRINIDTGAVYGGRLTAAIFAPGEDVQFFHT